MGRWFSSAATIEMQLSISLISLPVLNPLKGMPPMKVIDNQTEGIGFAIFAPEILRLLKIDLKD